MARTESSRPRPVAVGDEVLVQSGLDVVPGTVVDQYGEPPHVKLVVRLETDVEAGAEAPTVVAREAEVYPAADASELDPPGSWVSGAAFERAVSHAVRRLARSNFAHRRIRVDQGTSHDDPDLHIVDSSTQTPGRIVDVEVKFTRRPHLAASVIDRIAALLEKQSGDRGRLIVSNTELTGGAAGLLAARHIDYVTWRSPEDDPALAASLQRALSYEHPKTA